MYNCGHYRKGLWMPSMRARTSSSDGPGWGRKAGRTVDYLYSVILDGPSSLDRPSGPLGASILTCATFFATEQAPNFCYPAAEVVRRQVSVSMKSLRLYIYVSTDFIYQHRCV